MTCDLKCFSSILVISEKWEGDNEMLCAMKSKKMGNDQELTQSNSAPKGKEAHAQIYKPNHWNSSFSNRWPLQLP